MTAHSDPQLAVGTPAGDEQPGQVRPSWLLRELFPEEVVAFELLGSGNPSGLLAEERAYIERASLKRAHEFAAGRLCARAALEQFGISGFPLAMAEDRSPLWPRTVCGSIAHTHGYCAAVAGQLSRFRALGLDVEQVTDLPPGVCQQICSPAEAEWLEQLPRDERARVASLIFSAKETFYKCQYTLTRQWLEFADVTVDFAGWGLGAGSFTVRPLGISRLLQHQPLPWLGRFLFWEGLVITGMAFAV